MNARSPRPRVVAGIDEAGLGPMLGPLAIGFSAWRTGEREVDPWRALAPVVASDPNAPADFAVADSKLVFRRTRASAASLERTALGFLALLDRSRDARTRAGRLLFETPIELAPEDATVARHPWYRDLARELPCACDAEDLERRVATLDRACERARLALADGGVRVLPEGALNASFEATASKSRTLWDGCAPILRRLWDRFGLESELTVAVDRHGGRARYADLLRDTFPEAEVSVQVESPAESLYGLRERGGERAMSIAFASRAERRWFAVALASCFAKYARETAMASFNAWFAAREPALRPTAGYVTDARRWLADAEAAIERERLDRSLLVRAR